MKKIKKIKKSVQKIDCDYNNLVKEIVLEYQNKDLFFIRKEILKVNSILENLKISIDNSYSILMFTVFFVLLQTIVSNASLFFNKTETNWWVGLYVVLSMGFFVLLMICLFGLYNEKQDEKKAKLYSYYSIRLKTLIELENNVSNPEYIEYLKEGK